MSEMSGRENLLSVINRQSCDHIPVSPFIHINYVKEFFGTHDVDWVAKTPEVYQHFGFDLIHRNCTPAFDVLGASSAHWEVEVNVDRKERDSTTTTLVHTPWGDLRRVEAERYSGWDSELATTNFPIKSEADLVILERGMPTLGNVDCTDIRRARKIVGDEGIIAPWVDGAFNFVVTYYRRLDDLLVDAVDHPAFYSRMMDFLLERNRAFIQQFIAAGVDMLSYSGNVANAKLVSPAFFQKFVLPYELKLIAFIQDQGVPVIYHNCGRARKLIPSYPSLGMKAYESLTPPPYGDTDLAEAVAIFGKQVTLSGNIDQLDLLRKGTRADIEAAVQSTMNMVRGKVPFILATTDYFNENTPHENIHALAEAGRKFGYN